MSSTSLSQVELFSGVYTRRSFRYLAVVVGQYVGDVIAGEHIFSDYIHALNGLGRQWRLARQSRGRSRAYQRHRRTLQHRLNAGHDVLESLGGRHAAVGMLLIGGLP